MGDTLFHKVWNTHAVRTLPTGQTQLLVGLHLIHEVTTPQAFDMLHQHGWRVAFPERTFATVDHIVPTTSLKRPFLDVMARARAASLERNCREAGIPLWAAGSVRVPRLPRGRSTALGRRQREPGNRPRDRSGARAHATAHGNRV